MAADRTPIAPGAAPPLRCRRLPYLPPRPPSRPSAAPPRPAPPRVQLMIPAEAAHDTVSALGEVGMLQFKDLNAERSAFQRTYANQVRRGCWGWVGRDSKAIGLWHYNLLTLHSPQATHQL